MMNELLHHENEQETISTNESPLFDETEENMSSSDVDTIRELFSLFFREFGTLIKLNLLFLLYSLTGIGIPAALTAMNGILSKLFRGLPVKLRSDFKDYFKSEFKNSLFAGLFYLAGFSAIYIGLQVYFQMSESNKFMSIPGVLLLILAVLLIFMSFYTFLMIAIIDLPFSLVLRNSVGLSVLQAPQNLLSMLLLAGIIYFYLRFFPLSLIALPFFSFSFCGLITSFCAMKGLRKYVMKE